MTRLNTSRIEPLEAEISTVSSASFKTTFISAATLRAIGRYGSKYRLTADLTRLDQPMMGFDMTVGSTVRYSLIETQTRKEVYARVIQISYTAKMSDAFLVSQRLKLANEGAVKANIEAFIKDLIALKLP